MRLRTTLLFLFISAVCGYLAGNLVRWFNDSVVHQSTPTRHNTAGQSLTILDTAKITNPADSSEAEFYPVDVNDEGQLVLPKELLPFFLPFPGPIVDDSGGITEEFIRFLHLPPSTVTELQNLIDVTSSSVENLMRKSAHYNYDETGQIDWVYIAPYDDDALRKSFANSLTRLLSKDFAETILQEHSFINKMFGTLSGGERTYRFEHLNDRIRVYTGMTSNPAEADVTVFLDLPEKLPWWIARIIEVEETPEN